MMVGPAPEHDIPSDLTSQITEQLKLTEPCESGSFGVVYQCTINISECMKEVAVKLFKIDPRRTMEKHERAIHRELKVWLRLSKHPTVVPLLGIAYVGSSFPALVSQWMPSGTLYMYLEQGTITDSAKVKLVMGVADGLKYLHSEDVVHGDLHPANVLVDGSGRPRLTDFGLATVAGDPESQLSTTTAGRTLNPRWRAPEVIGIHSDNEKPVPPNFKSDMYSFGGVMFFIVSGVTPWKEKNPHQIIAELLKRATPARPDNILDDRWNLIRKCWSWNPLGRPEATEITTVFRKIEMAESTIWATAWTSAQSQSQMSKNVVIFGQSGVGKSSLFNMLCPGANARTSNDPYGCTEVEHKYTCYLGQRQSCQLHDTIGLEGGFGGVLWAPKAEKRLKTYLRMINPDLLIYCMPGVESNLKKSYGRNFNKFKSVVGSRVPVVVVVTNLEDSENPEGWWSANLSVLRKLDIPESTRHACVSTLPEVHISSRLYQTSREAVRALIRNNLPSH